jgi:hypothetical protein
MAFVFNALGILAWGVFAMAALLIIACLMGEK